MLLEYLYHCCNFQRSSESLDKASKPAIFFIFVIFNLSYWPFFVFDWHYLFSSVIILLILHFNVHINLFNLMKTTFILILFIVYRFCIIPECFWHRNICRNKGCYNKKINFQILMYAISELLQIVLSKLLRLPPIIPS